MDKKNIKALMIEQIRASAIEAAREAIEEIDEDSICDFLWSKDFGREIFEDFVEDIKKDILDEIFDDIDFDDLNLCAMDLL